MRTTFFFAALLLVAALAALLVERHRSAPASAVATPGTATLVGDSLNVGVERYLPDALPHWRIVANDRVGRTTDEGIAELEADRPALSSHVVVSLGTNDPADVPGFRADVARVLELIGPSRCVVWATIWRNGKPDDAFNDVLPSCRRREPPRAARRMGCDAREAPRLARRRSPARQRDGLS